ncbi:MAG TPA: hypothetical protein VGK29_06945 [Paludibaculum sp.]|jgi:hypothetical protein
MKTNLPARTASMILGLLLATGLGFSKTPANDVRVTVRLYSYVNLPADAPSEMAATAKRVLRQAGVAVEFIECSSAGVAIGRTGCTGSLESAVLMLRIFEPKRAGHAKQLGYAAMTDEGGSCITLFVDPTKRMARIETLSDWALLGHAAAHEIGHLLLGSNSHTPTGIMRPTWRRGDEEGMAKGALRFDGRQARKMQTTLLALSAH